MADLSWLRLGQRSRTCNTPRSPTTSERTSAHELQPGECRKHDPSQVSAYLSLNSRASNSPERLASGSNGGLLVREQDRIWYNPSLEQMVDALQVAIMSNGILSPIPVEYNTYVLHLIEGFAVSREKMRAVDAAYAGVKQSLEQNLEEFKSLVDDWLTREIQYKAEIKRLEVLLSRTSREGLEAVALARTHSIVDRSGPEAKGLISRLTRLSSHHRDDISRGQHDKPCGKPNHTILPESSSVVPLGESQWTLKPTDDIGSRGSSAHGNARRVALPKILDKDNDKLISEKLERLEAAARANAHHCQRGRRRYRTWRPTEQACQDSSAVTLEAKPALANKFIREPRALFLDDVLAPTGSSDGSDANTHDSEAGGWYNRQCVLGRLLDEDDDAFPRGRYPTTPQERLGQPRRDFKHRRGFSSFSFVPGDDAFPAPAGRLTQHWGVEKQEGGDNIELRPCDEQVPRRKTGGEIQSLVIEESRSHTEPATGVASSMRPREDRSPQSTQKDSFFAHGSVSGTNAVVRDPQRRPIKKSHESASTELTFRRVTPSGGSPGPDSGASSIVERDTPVKQLSEANARIAAARAVAHSRVRRGDGHAS
ncbi:hypothetical protein F4775DRAFT_196936 [Biscogniauxia sp. FL1348]|nr:hypothetical protein F4775DRAFT_196936 [Biscogniauxia sp. FL1348]